MGRLEGHTDWVTAVAFSPDSRLIVSGSSDNTLRLWEVASGQSRLREGHTDNVSAVTFSPDGLHIVSGSNDKTLRLWEVASGHEVARFDGDGKFNVVALAPDGQSVAAGNPRGRVHLLDILLDEADKANRDLTCLAKSVSLSTPIVSAEETPV